MAATETLKSYWVHFEMWKSVEITKTAKNGNKIWIRKDGKKTLILAEIEGK